MSFFHFLFLSFSLLEINFSYIFPSHAFLFQLRRPFCNYLVFSLRFSYSELFLPLHFIPSFQITLSFFTYLHALFLAALFFSFFFSFCRHLFNRSSLFFLLYSLRFFFFLLATYSYFPSPSLSFLSLFTFFLIFLILSSIVL